MLPSDNQLSSGKSATKSRVWMLLIQFTALLVITVLFTVFDWDRQIASLFYAPDKGWFLGKQPLWVWLHDYGTIPGIILTLAALMIWVASFYKSNMRQWRKPCLVVVLTTILAAGLLVNAVLKQYWGRPRPSQTVDFGGKWDYRPIYPPGTPGKGASFPCGHCTMGFVFLAAASFRRQSKLLAYSGVAAGIVLGGLLSAARVVQGAHFVSDTIWSLGIVWMVAIALEGYLAEPDRKQTLNPISPGRRALITLCAIIAIIAISAGFMTRRPYYSTMVYALNYSPMVDTIHIKINTDPESFNVVYEGRKNGRIKVDAHGFGWMEHDYRMGFGSQITENVLSLTIHIEVNSYFAELDHAITLVLPEFAKGKFNLRLNQQPVQPIPQQSVPQAGMRLKVNLETLPTISKYE